MELGFYEKLSIRIIALFITAMLLSFIPDYLHDFLGDWKCVKEHISWGAICNGNEIHWGWRHFLWAFMCICLFVVQSVKIFYYINNNTDVN